MKKFFKNFYLLLIFLFLYAPIVVLMIFSFNDSKSRRLWNGFTTRWYVELFQDADIVCEAFDNPEAKAMLVNEILEKFPEKKLVSATGMAGFGSSNTIVTRRMTKNFYLCGDRVSEPSYGKGLMAPRVAICAAHEANMITRLLLGEEEI